MIPPASVSRASALKRVEAVLSLLKGRSSPRHTFGSRPLKRDIRGRHACADAGEETLHVSVAERSRKQLNAPLDDVESALQQLSRRLGHGRAFYAASDCDGSAVSGDGTNFEIV